MEMRGNAAPNRARYASKQHRLGELSGGQHEISAGKEQSQVLFRAQQAKDAGRSIE
jgi:hypothetical protein